MELIAVLAFSFAVGCLIVSPLFALAHWVAKDKK